MPEEENQNSQSDEERQEYYIDTIQDIVDEQKEKLGEETALKWVRRAPIQIDSDGNVTGFYGKGEDALETLREFTEHEEFYLTAIQQIIDHISNFMGEDIAYKFARKAPLQITPDGEVQAYYGTGRKALEILIDSYEDYLGDQVADSQIKDALKDIEIEEKQLIPERVRPGQNKDTQESSESLGFIKKILG
ncbi:MAG: hypothetical protein ABEI78_02160 [Candidatus Nanohaloarchaea archaeon]